jgi:hypothetical protein
MSFDEDNVHVDPLKNKVDTITSLLVVVSIALFFTLVMLGVSHQHLEHRLGRVEQALRTARP